jgi:hypothetical protein
MAVSPSAARWQGLSKIRFVRAPPNPAIPSAEHRVARPTPTLGSRLEASPGLTEEREAKGARIGGLQPHTPAEIRQKRIADFFSRLADTTQTT